MARPKKYNHNAKVGFMIPQKAYEFTKFVAKEIYGTTVSEFMRTITPIYLKFILENRNYTNQHTEEEKNKTIELLNNLQKIKFS